MLAVFSNHPFSCQSQIEQIKGSPGNLNVYVGLKYYIISLSEN